MTRLQKVFLLSTIALSIGLNGIIIAPSISKADVVYCANCGTEWTQLANKVQLVQQVQTAMQQLQTQLHQYQNMVTNTLNLPNQIWGNTMADIGKLNALLQQSQALSYSAGNLDGQFAQQYGTYPSYLSRQMNGTDWQNKYNQWSQQTSDNALYTLKAISLQSTQMSDEDAVMQQLQTMSQSAQGRMQALQVGNMMAAQAVRQIQKLRQLMMLQLQMQANYLATQQDRQSAEDAAARQFFNAPLLQMGNEKRY